MFPVNPIYASALSRSHEFFDELGHFMKMPFRAFEYNKAIVPLFKDGPLWTSPVELLVATSNFYCALNEQTFNVREFCLFINDLTGESVCVSDIGPDFHDGHGLLEHECLVLEASHFWLPKSHDDYLAGLEHDDRKTICLLHNRNSHVQIRIDNTGTELWKPMREHYAHRMMKHFGYTEVMARTITGTVDISLRHMARLGTAFVMGLFIGGKQVAVSICERSRGCVFHYTDITDPAYGKNLCKFSIAKAIEWAISQGDLFFDVGHLWDDESMVCDFSYKRRYVPKREKRKNKLLCFSWMTQPGREQYFKSYPNDKLYAPFFLDGKLILQHQRANQCLGSSTGEHRTLYAEDLRSNRSRGTNYL